MSYNSKYTGEQVEEFLDQIANGEIGGGIEAETDPIFSASPAASITDAKKEEWDNKVDKVSGKQLSTEDFTTTLKQKLDGLSNYDDTQINEAVESLQSQLNTLVSGDASNAIESFNEIIAFLNGIEDSQSLESIIASIEQQIADKQDAIDDIEDIREGASKGLTALQSNKYTNEEVEKLLDSISNLEAAINTHNKEVRFFCIEPVVVKVGDVEHQCEANQVATIFVGDEDFEIIPTSNNSIQSLLGYPIPLTWYDWLEGVEVFSNIIFDMNELDTYKHWIQYYQGDYHVQKAQYTDCVFWSDKPYTHNPFEERTNYTIYYSSQLPLCYSTIPENTYKPFYLAYGVNTDPNWRNPDYVNSYANVSGATQTFSYYGATAIGIFDMGVDIIALPKDCRGLMYHAPAIQHAGVFDATKTTNFGAKKGSWQEAFGDCISLTTLYIQNLKASINISWSPISVKSIEYIVSNAANTSAITISVSPYTWYRLSEDIKATAKAKNITIALLVGNYVDDVRWGTVYQKPETGIPASDLEEGVQEVLDKATELNVTAVDTSEEVEEPDISYVTKQELDNAIASAITTTLNTEV